MGEVPYNRRMEGLMLGASGHIYYSVDSPRLQQTFNPFTEIWQQVCKTSWYFDPCRMKFFATQKQFVNLNDS